jgi:hypothetical protein
MLSRVTLSLLVVLLVLLHAFLKTILSRVYFFFALFPSPFFGGPFPLLFIRTACPSFEYLPGTTTSIVDRLMLFLRVFSPWVHSCRSMRFGIFSPRPGLSFSCSPLHSPTSLSISLFRAFLLSRRFRVLHFTLSAVFFSL